jgi:hypothetical protein
MFGSCGRTREVGRATALRVLPSMDALRAVGTPPSVDGSADGSAGASAGGARWSFGKVTNFCAKRKADGDCQTSTRARPHMWRERLTARREPACEGLRGADEFGAPYATGLAMIRCGGAGLQRRLRNNLACGLSLLLELSGKRSFDGCAGLGEARRRGNDLGKRRGGLGKQRGRGIGDSANDIGSRHRGRLQGLVMVKHPARQDGLGRFLNPSIDQGGDLLTQVGGVIQTSELKTLQRSA